MSKHRPTSELANPFGRRWRPGESSDKYSRAAKLQLENLHGDSWVLLGGGDDVRKLTSAAESVSGVVRVRRGTEELARFENGRRVA